MTEPTSPEPVSQPTGFLLPADPPRRPRWPWIAGAAAVVVLAAGGIVWALLPSTEDKAIERCQDEIRGRLKSPSTAVFLDGVRMDNSADVYRVYGEVDAQNGFGATVRGEYRCLMRATDSGGWTGVEATFTQR